MPKTTILAGLMSLFAVGIIFSYSPTTASAIAIPDPNNDYLDVKKAIINIDKDVITDIVFKTRGEIPKYGTEENFGYGVVTSVNGTLNVIATTSHPNLGIVDSELQVDEHDPVFHNHYVVLGTDAENCGIDEQRRPNLSIADLSFESPGEVFIKDNAAILRDLPPSAEGQFTGEEITPGTNITIVASFLLESVFDEQRDLAAVCVTDVRPVEPIDERTVIIGEKDFKPDYPRPDYGNNDAYGNDYLSEDSSDREYYHQPRY
jgi:hypothetical protein